MRDLRRAAAGGDAEGRGSTWVRGTGILVLLVGVHVRVGG